MVGDFKCIELLLVLNLEQKGGIRVASYDDDNDDDRNRKNDKISNRTVHYYPTFVNCSVTMRSISINL